MPVMDRKEIAVRSFAYFRRDVLNIRKEIVSVPVDQWETIRESFHHRLADMEGRLDSEIYLYADELLHAGFKALAECVIEQGDKLRKDVI